MTRELTIERDRLARLARGSASEKMLGELQASHEISVATAPDYVIGFMCRELAAMHVVSDRALAPTPRR